MKKFVITAILIAFGTAATVTPGKPHIFSALTLFCCSILLSSILIVLRRDGTTEVDHDDSFKAKRDGATELDHDVSFAKRDGAIGLDPHDDLFKG